MRRSLLLAAFAVTLAAAAPARAQIQTSVAETYPGKFAVDAHMGFTAGLVGGTPGGFKIAAGFGYRLTEVLWLDVGFDAVIGGGQYNCANNNLGPYDCGFFGWGNAIEPAAGVKLKFKVEKLPLVPYMKINAVFMGVVNRYCGDNGLGLGGRVGGGVKYFITKNVGLGIEVNTLIGPAWYNGPNACPFFVRAASHVELYWSFDAAVGGEFAF